MEGAAPHPSSARLASSLPSFLERVVIAAHFCTLSPSIPAPSEAGGSSARSSATSPRRPGKAMTSFAIRPRSYGSSEYEIRQDEKLSHIIRAYGAFGAEVVLFDAAGNDSRLLTAKNHGVFSAKVDISNSTGHPVTLMEHGRLIHINTFEYNGRSYRWKPKLGLKYNFKLLEAGSEAPLATLKSKYPFSLGGECTLVVSGTNQDPDWLHLLLLTSMVMYKQIRAKANARRTVPVY